MCVCVHMCRCLWRSEVLDPPGAVGTTVSQQTWVLGTRLRSSARASTPSHWATSQPFHSTFQSGPPRVWSLSALLDNRLNREHAQTSWTRSSPHLAAQAGCGWRNSCLTSPPVSLWSHFGCTLLGLPPPTTSRTLVLAIPWVCTEILLSQLHYTHLAWRILPFWLSVLPPGTKAITLSQESCSFSYLLSTTEYITFNL